MGRRLPAFLLIPQQTFMFSLYKIAISLDEVISGIKPNQLRGAIWKNNGYDPGEIPQTFTDKFKSLIRESVPKDISQDWYGPAAVFAKKVLLASVSSSNLINEKIVDFNLSVEPRKIAFEIEDYYKYSYAKDEFSKATGKRPGDIASFNSYDELYKINTEIEPYYIQKIQSVGGEKYIKSIEPNALLDTSLVVGDKMPSLPLNKGKVSFEMAEADAKNFNPSEWTVLTPTSAEAAKYWGHGTNWCTSHKDDEYNRFYEYNESGRLFIFINNTTGRRYQIHFESDQMMDENDDPIPFKLGMKLRSLIANMPFAPKPPSKEDIYIQVLNLNDSTLPKDRSKIRENIELLGNVDQYGLLTSKVDNDGYSQPSIKTVLKNNTNSNIRGINNIKYYWSDESEQKNDNGIKSLVYRAPISGFNEFESITIKNDNTKYLEATIGWNVGNKPRDFKTLNESNFDRFTLRLNYNGEQLFYTYYPEEDIIEKNIKSSFNEQNPEQYLTYTRDISSGNVALFNKNNIKFTQITDDQIVDIKKMFEYVDAAKKEAFADLLDAKARWIDSEIVQKTANFKLFISKI